MVTNYSNSKPKPRQNCFRLKTGKWPLEMKSPPFCQGNFHLLLPAYCFSTAHAHRKRLFNAMMTDGVKLEKNPSLSKTPLSIPVQTPPPLPARPRLPVQPSFPVKLLQSGLIMKFYFVRLLLLVLSTSLHVTSSRLVDGWRRFLLVYDDDDDNDDGDEEEEEYDDDDDDDDDNDDYGH